MPQHDDDGSDALNLQGTAGETGSDEHSPAEADPLIFSGADDEAAVDPLDEYTPAQSGDTGGAAEALDVQARITDEEQEWPVGPFMAINLAETVSVSSRMDGSIEDIDLSPKVTSMSESDLAEEILAVAELARQEGQAGRYNYIFQVGQRLGIAENEAISEMLQEFLDLPTPEKAE